MYFSYLPLLQTLEKGFRQNVTTSTHSSEEEKCFTCALPAQPCFFFIEEKEWQALRKHQYGRLFQGLQWTNLIAKGIRSVHPYCSFVFKRHSVKTLLSQKPGPVFTCVGYCRFTDCPVRAHVEVTDECTLKATVVFSGGDVCHNTHELKRRPVRADARQFTAELLQTKLPRSLYLESMHKLPQMVIDSGCRDDAPSKDVLKNITWSERKIKWPHSDEFTSLKKIIDEQPGTDNYVLQNVLMHPKGIMLWSRKTLSVFYKRSKEDIVYLDATGSVIKKKSTKSTILCVWIGGKKSIQGGFTFTCCKLCYMWPHNSICHILSAVFPNRPSQNVWKWVNQKASNDYMWWLPCGYALHIHYILQNRSGGFTAEILPVDHIWPPHSS